MWLLEKSNRWKKKPPLLTKIDSKFYSETLEYLEDSGEIPEEEIQTIKRIIDNIYEQREKKIMKAALSKARGGKPDFKEFFLASLGFKSPPFKAV